MIRRHSLFSLILVALFALTWTGCDSADSDDDGEVTDAEVFVGTWTVTRLVFDERDVSTLVLTQFSEMEARFDADGDFEGLVIAADDGELREAEADYAVSEDASAEGEGTITFSGQDFDEAATLDYTIENNSRIALAADDAAFIFAFARLEPEDLPEGFEFNSFSLVLSRAN